MRACAGGCGGWLQGWVGCSMRVSKARVHGTSLLTLPHQRHEGKLVPLPVPAGVVIWRASVGAPSRLRPLRVAHTVAMCVQDILRQAQA